MEENSQTKLQVVIYYHYLVIKVSNLILILVIQFIRKLYLFLMICLLHFQQKFVTKLFRIVSSGILIYHFVQFWKTEFAAYSKHVGCKLKVSPTPTSALVMFPLFL